MWCSGYLGKLKARRALVKHFKLLFLFVSITHLPHFLNLGIRIRLSLLCTSPRARTHKTRVPIHQLPGAGPPQLVGQAVGVVSASGRRLGGHFRPRREGGRPLRGATPGAAAHGGPLGRGGHWRRPFARAVPRAVPGSVPKSPALQGVTVRLSRAGAAGVGGAQRTNL